MLQRQHLINYNWESNAWDFDKSAIEANFAHTRRAVTDPNDLSFLLAQFHDLDESAQKYLLWASFFGAT